jgi:hypothetical protein
LQTLKGSGGDLIVCEEAAYMDPQVFYEVVVPLLGLRETAMIAISTILDPSNFYTKLVDMKDAEGNGLFDVQKFELVCPACRKTETPWKCTHMTETMPPWLSEDKHTKIRNFLPQELIGRETMGITMSDATKAFDGKIVKQFEQAEPVALPVNFAETLRSQVTRTTIQHDFTLHAREVPGSCIFTAVDPNGGGLSEYAVASILFAGGQHLVRHAAARPPYIQ